MPRAPAIALIRRPPQENTLDIPGSVFYHGLTVTAELPKKDFFISYNCADQAWAEWIAWQLENAGYSGIIQAWDFRPGSNFILEMQKAAAGSARTIAVLSDQYLNALYTQPEWTAAFIPDPTGSEGKLLPIRIRECRLEGLWRAIVYIDLAGLHDAQKAKARLLAGIRRESLRPQTEPPFPEQQTVSKTQPRFPGRVPAVWNVPHPRNPNFTGREDLLAALHDALNTTGATVLTQALHGLGGVGKTQTALEYSYRYGFEYDLVWWLGAEESVKLAADYADLAVKLNLPEKDLAGQPAIVAAVREYLRTHPHWLLVFDNAREPGQIKPFLPGGQGHVLVTSRNHGWDELAGDLPVAPFPREQAVQFLLNRSQLNDAAAAATLAAALGDLPLALEQAGAYIRTIRGLDLAGYLERFKIYRTSLFNHGRKPTAYPDTVATTWEVSFQAVAQESQAAADLLHLCAFLAPDAIPLDILRQYADQLPEVLKTALADDLACDEMLALLQRYSLLEVAPDTLAIHRLVQAVIRDRLDDAGRQQWAGAAVNLVNDAFPGDEILTDPNSWPLCARLLPHALAAAGHAEACKVGLEAAGRLLNQAGLYLRDRADYAGARTVYEQCLPITEKVFGFYHPNMTSLINNLGNVLKDLGDLNAAKAHYERALAIDEKVFGPDHPNIATTLNNLGLVLQLLGDLNAAKTNFERALAIWEKKLGSDHPQVATALNNLGSVLMTLGDLNAAKAHYECALAIDEKVFGPDHPNIAAALNNLGLVLKDLGDPNAAKAHYERALAIDEQVLGPDHPKVATDLNNLGSILKGLGDLSVAKAYFERALDIDEAVYGHDHPEVARDLNNLGLVLHDLGDLSAAKAHFERALDIWEKQLGPNHPQVAIGLNNLGLLLLDPNDLHAAKDNFERALAIDEQVFGTEHPNVARDVNNLGGVLKDLGDLTAARAHFERALAIFTKFLGPDHPKTELVRRNLAALDA